MSDTYVSRERLRLLDVLASGDGQNWTDLYENKHQQQIAETMYGAQADAILASTWLADRDALTGYTPCGEDVRMMQQFEGSRPVPFSSLNLGTINGRTSPTPRVWTERRQRLVGTYVQGCFRCELSKEEAVSAMAEELDELRGLATVFERLAKIEAWQRAHDEAGMGIPS